MTTSGQSVALIAFAVALLAFVALRHAAPPTGEAPADALGELGALVEDGERALLVGQLACEAVAEEERGACLSRLDDLQATVRIARGVQVTGETCRREQQAECLTSALEQARALVPELRRAVAALAAPKASAAPSASTALLIRRGGATLRAPRQRLHQETAPCAHPANGRTQGVPQ